MHSNLGIRTNTRLAAGGFAALSWILPPTAIAQSTVYVDGIVRDFLAAHPDFGLPALGSTGHWAGALDLSLVSGQRPGLVPGGFEVTTEWTEKASNNIAPHLYRDPLGRALRLVEPPQVDKLVTLDTWDPALGPYGGLNVGPAPAIEVLSPMPVVTLPVMGPSVGDVMLQDILTLSSDIHCDNLSTKKDTVIAVDAKITILCEGNFVLGQNTTITILPGASLTVYIRGDTAVVNQESSINMTTWDPDVCVFYYLGSGTLDLNQETKVCAHIIAPNGTVFLHQADQLYGSITARSAIFNQTTGYHAVPMGTPQDSCGVDLADLAGVAGAAGNGQVTSAATFSEWFSDVLGVNQSTVHAIAMVDDGTGVYEYLDDDFHPIDGLLLGNEGAAHNENFTFTIAARFVYSSCVGQFLSIAGGDGLWVFIDGVLVIDLAGVDYAMDQYIDLDRLGLSDGQACELRVFYASRNSESPAFNFRTNIPLITAEPPFNVTGVAD